MTYPWVIHRVADFRDGRIPEAEKSVVAIENLDAAFTTGLPRFLPYRNG